MLAIKAMRAAQVPVRLIAFEGETREDLYDSFPERERARIKVGQIGKMLRALKRVDARYALFVGQITPGRLFRDLTPDLKAVAMLARLKERNAETIFGSIVDEVKKVGVEVVDARSFMDNHLAVEGLMTADRQIADPSQVEFGVRMARAVAQLDIGQGVVVRKGTVLAVEAFEGTDDMLARANKYKTDQLIFVKTSKPTQNVHFDWPVFGENTLLKMAEAGITTVALEADRTIMLDRPFLLDRARALRIECIGYR